MFIVVNKDFSIAQIEPSTVYQGSNNANELAIFAPFSVSSYASVTLAIMLPSGEYIAPITAFPTETQVKGFGAWSVLLPPSVTAIPGEVRCSLTFNGTTTSIVTEAAEITVNASVPTLPTSPPSANVYEEILSALSSILERHPDWTENATTDPSYIANKPPITPVKNSGGVITGAEVKGSLEVTGSLTVGGDSLGALLDEKLDKITPSNSGTYLYSVEKYNGVTTNGYIKAASVPTAAAVALYDSNENLATGSPIYSADCVNLGFFNQHIPIQLLYNGTTGVLSLADINNNIIGSVDLPLEMTVSGARYEDGFLILTFTNGETVRISLEELMLPAWVTNLQNIPSGSENVPPTAKAVKEYAAPVVRNTVTGTAFVVDDYAENINNNHISASAAATVKVYGQNLINPQTAKPNSSTDDSIIINGSEIVLKSGSKYGVSFEVFIPKGSTVIVLLDWNSGDSSDAPGVRLGKNNASGSTLVNIGTPFVATEDYDRLLIYKPNPNVGLTSDATISNISLSYAISEPYTPFTDMQKFTVSAGQQTPVDLDSFGGYVTVISQTPEVPVTMQYTRDLSKTIDNLTKKIADLQNAIAT